MGRPSTESADLDRGSGQQGHGCVPPNGGAPLREYKRERSLALGLGPQSFPTKLRAADSEWQLVGDSGGIPCWAQLEAQRLGPAQQSLPARTEAQAIRGTAVCHPAGQHL